MKNLPYPSYNWKPFYIRLSDHHHLREGHVIQNGFSQTPHKILRAYRDNFFKRWLRTLCRWILRYAERTEGQYKVQAIKPKP